MNVLGMSRRASFVSSTDSRARRGLGSLHGTDDRFDVIGERDLRAVGIGGLEAGQRQRRDHMAGSAQLGRDLVPGPRAQPESGNQDDRCRHGSMLLLEPAKR